MTQEPQSEPRYPTSGRTMYYVCEQCGKACDFYTVKEIGANWEVPNEIPMSACHGAPVRVETGR